MEYFVATNIPEDRKVSMFLTGVAKLWYMTRTEEDESAGCSSMEIWDMKEYFVAANIPKDRHVSMASMFLVGADKLWYRTHIKEDESAGCSRMEMLKVLAAPTWRCLYVGMDYMQEYFVAANAGYPCMEMFISGNGLYAGVLHCCDTKLWYSTRTE